MSSNGNERKPTPLEQRIISQIEFYFGDNNLPRDRFMLEQTELDNGWIPMSIMLRFKMLAKISKNAHVIASAVKFSQLMEVDTTGPEAKLRRSPKYPLPDLINQSELNRRTVYATGFSRYAPKEDIIAFFEKHGPIDRIHFRKIMILQTSEFRGSVFARFSTREKAEAFLNEKNIQFGETEIVKMWADDYRESSLAQFFFS